jgi:lysophospholipase L1-like esterase
MQSYRPANPRGHLLVRSLLVAAVCISPLLSSRTSASASEPPSASGKRLLPTTTAGHGLGNTFARLREGKSVTLGYFGGSITTGVGSSNPDALSYRALTTAWFKAQYPGAKISEANAAIGGTGSVIGASRIDKDLIPSHPDLVLIEFAVNDNGADRDTLGRAMERIIRTLRTRLPDTDILMVYTMQADRMYDFYKSGETPDSVVYHQPVAEHYGCSSVNVGQELFNQIHSGKATWKDLAPDTCHPSDAGYRLYFEQIRDFLEKHKRDKPRRQAKTLPKPLYPENAQQ